MSDTTGWRKNDDIWEKVMRGGWWTISDMPPPFTLRLDRKFIATRATLRECQRLAHATARLWSGEKEC